MHARPKEGVWYLCVSYVSTALIKFQLFDFIGFLFNQKQLVGPPGFEPGTSTMSR